jgi:ribonucleoside-diphosphate reductase alpha chain
MKVIKRSGVIEDMLFDKVTQRIKKLASNLNVVPDKVAQKTFYEMYDGISTSKIDDISADISANMMTVDPDYAILASRILVSNMHKTHPKTFSECMNHIPNVSDAIKEGAYRYDELIVPDRDYLFDYFGLKTMQKVYLNVGETPQYMFLRVSLGIHGDDYGAVKETYDLLSTKKFTHATPTMINAGTNMPQMSSCFLTTVEDSIHGIYNNIGKCAQISKHAGGIGIHIHDVRSKGSKIRGTDGVSDGIIPMLRVYNSTARYVNQSGRRKGSFAVYLEPWHPDVFDFLELRLNQGDEEARCRDLFTAMWIPDLFMKKVEANEDWALFDPDECPGLSTSHGAVFEELYNEYLKEGKARKIVPAVSIWNAMIKSQVETGTPYMLYKDTCNKRSNQRNLGTLKGSNLCVPPETKILTKNGYQMICTLIHQPVEIWNGEEWSIVDVKKTSEASRIVRVNFSDGTFLDCTEYHKFHIQIGYGSKSEIKEAKSLIPGDKLIKWTPPSSIEFGEDVDYHAYTHGFFCGDGTYNSTYKGEKIIPTVSLYGEKKKLIEHLDIRSTSGNEDAQGRINVQLPYNLPPKFNVPSDKNVKTRLEWLAGLCDADGHVQSCPGNPTQKSVCIASIHMSFLREIQLMLHTLGVSSVIGLLHEACDRDLPDGKGGTKTFHTQTCWRITVSALGVETLIKNGFKTHRLNIDDFTPTTRDTRQYVRVVSVENNHRVDETYCFNEPKRHTGIFNGVIAGNCTEILEHTSEDEIAVCNLASLSLPVFVDGYGFDFEELHKVTKVVTRNLNKVIDRNFYPVPEARKSNMKHRPIGIGVQGLADVYMMLEYPFDSKEASDLNLKIFECIYHAALEESVELAKIHGSYESFNGSPASEGLLQFDLAGVTKSFNWNYDWDAMKAAVIRHGLRNSLLLAPMPTATTSQVLGNNECFEPYTTNLYLRRTLAGEFVIVNKHLVRKLQKLGLWSTEMKDEIIRHNGSIQNISGIPSETKKLFKTAWELSQKVIIDQARDRGYFICQSQSMNLFVESPTTAKLTSMHFYAWKQGLKTGMYYLRTRPKAAPIQVTIDPCISCGA